MAAAQVVLKGAGALTRGAQAMEGPSLLAALDALRLREAAAPAPQPASVDAGRPELRKTMSIHVGGELRLPVRENRYVAPAAEAEPAAASAPEAEVRRNPFEGVPLLALAERLGARLMPAYEVLKEEQRRAKLAEKAGAAEPQPLRVPAIPHLLPFTRWAASSKTIQDTFIVDDPKTRKKARLSWYNPYDGMVPSGWFKDGLLKDLAYYRPFSSSPSP